MLSRYNSKISKERLLSEQESLYFDRKSFSIKPKKLANSIISFANANGWVIALWIKDWNFEHLDDVWEVRKNDFFQILHDHVHPMPKVNIEEIEIDSKKILLFHIDHDYERVFETDDKKKDVYLRVWDESKRLNYAEVEKLWYDKEIRRFEDEVCKDFDESDFDHELINEYLAILKTNEDYKKVFDSKSIAKYINWEYFFRNSAVLLFANDPDKYLPSSYIRYVRYQWDVLESWERYNVVKDENIKWPIVQIINDIDSFLNISLKDYFYRDKWDWLFKSTPEYPREARLEWVVNALTHRSYNRIWNPIVIHHYDSKLIIENSGPLPSNVTVKNIMKHRYARNPRIASVLYDFGTVRQLWEWVKRIYAAMNEIELSDPVYINQNNVVSLKLINEIKDVEWLIWSRSMKIIEEKFSELSKIEIDIITYLISHWRITTNQASILLNKTATTVRKYFNNLIALGILQKIAKNQRDPSAYFIFNKDKK